MEYTISKFYDDNSGMFYYTNSDDEVLVTRKREIFDNVIPSSNSIIAKNLFKLSRFFEILEYDTMSKQMLNNVTDKFRSNGASLSNWGLLMLDVVEPKKEVVICGEEAITKLKELQKTYNPNIIWAVDTEENNDLPLLKHRFVAGKTLIYVCVNNTCKLPIENLSLVN